VVAFGPVHLTEPAVARILAKRAEVHFLTRFGLPKGRLCPADDRRSDVRLAQYRAFCDDAFRLAVARSIVSAKVMNCRQLVMRYVRNHPDAALKQKAAELKKRAANAAKAGSLESLLGNEGSAAKLYFEAFETMVGDEKLFDGRSRRPPADPANALMSLGYTLLGGEIAGILAAHGLDPYIGFYHKARRGLPALAQDVLEEFRAPIVDRLVLSLLNRGVLTHSDFVAGPKGGLRLKALPLKLFLHEYEDALMSKFRLRDGSETTLRRMIDRQCACLRRATVEEANYEPFIPERT